MVTRGKSELLYAYLAGVMDADGHVGIHRDKKLPADQKRITVRHQPEMVVTNTDYALMELLAETFGGNIGTRRKEKPHHKTTYTWKASSRKALAVARALEPYMFIKKQQAQIIIEYYDGQPDLPLLQRAVRPEEIARREALLVRLRTLVDDRRPQRLNERATAYSG